MGVVRGLRNMYKLAKQMGQPQASHAFEGASQNRSLRSWMAPQTGPNIGMLGHATLVNRSRDLSRNDPWGAAMKERRVTNIVGTGIQPRSLAPEREHREAIQNLWKLWVKESDYEGVLSFYGQQEVLAGETHDAGECFGRKRITRLSDNVVVPLRIQLIEAEQVPVTHNIIAPNGNRVTAGIERDAENQRTAYHMYREHPGEMGIGMPGVNAGEIIRVPAEEMIHVYQPLRAGQLRGQPTITPILAKLYRIDEFDDATLMRQWVSTLFAGTVTKPNAGKSSVNPLTGEVGQDGAGDFDMTEVEAGTVQEMPPGWEMDWNTPPDAGRSYPDFMRWQLMASASAVGMSYEVLTQDMRGINDRLLRALLQEFRRRIRMTQLHIIAHQFCWDVWRTWMDLAVMSGRLDLPDYEARRHEYLGVRWVPEKWPYINPTQDVQADKDVVRGGFDSRSEIVAERGGDVEEVDRENKQDQERADEHGLVYDTDPRQTSGAGLTQGRAPGTELPWDEPDDETASAG